MRHGRCLRFPGQGVVGQQAALLTGAIWLAAVLLTACGNGANTGAVISIRIQNGPDALDRRFTLRCNPTGGDMPNRTALCRMIAKHPQAMLYPGDEQSVCIGGIGIPPSVSVSGTWRGRHVRRSHRVMCEWPGGAGALAYWAAAVSPRYLPVAAVRLHCDEDPSLQTTPIWASVPE